MRSCLESNLASVTIIFTLFLLCHGILSLLPESCKEVICAPGFAAQGPQWPSFFLASTVVIHLHSPQLGQVPKLYVLVMTTASQKAATMGECQLLHRLPCVLAHSAYHSIGQDVHSPEREKVALVGCAWPSCVTWGLCWFLLPDDAIGGAGTQQTLSDRNHAVNRLSSQSKTVTCCPKTIPVEEVESTFTGATGHFLPTLQGHGENCICEAFQTRSLDSPIPSGTPFPGILS